MFPYWYHSGLYANASAHHMHLALGHLMMNGSTAPSLPGLPFPVVGLSGNDGAPHLAGASSPVSSGSRTGTSTLPLRELHATGVSSCNGWSPLVAAELRCRRSGRLQQQPWGNTAWMEETAAAVFWPPVAPLRVRVQL